MNTRQKFNFAGFRRNRNPRPVLCAEFRAEFESGLGMAKFLQNKKVRFSKKNNEKYIYIYIYMCR